MRLAAWTLSEILREESGMSPSEIQAAIDRLSTKNLPLVEEVGGDLVVVATALAACLCPTNLIRAGGALLGNWCSASSG